MEPRFAGPTKAHRQQGDGRFRFRITIAGHRHSVKAERIRKHECSGVASPLRQTLRRSTVQHASTEGSDFH
jgi:hypothetical protein